LQALGLEAFREQIRATVPFLASRVGELTRWEDIRLLTVRVDRLRRWYRPGLLCIGDAAHAMSPIGGVGINLAIQDAIAAANILGPRLARTGEVRAYDLRRVQHRREFAAKMTQALQVFIGQSVVGRILSNDRSPLLGWLPVLARRLPFLSRIPARLVGLGFRPEHVRN
jgi:2-polyprenyl-6-methoxyphenol hydroxylase-like FAD-dependent oxidoreductase